MIDKLLEQRVELLNDLKRFIIMKDNDRSSRLQVAIGDLDEIIRQYLHSDNKEQEESQTTNLS